MVIDRELRTALGRSPVLLLSLLLVQSTQPAFSAEQERRPFADYEKVGVVVMAAAGTHDSGALKRQIATHLPPDVTLVLYGSEKDPKLRELAVTEYGQMMRDGRLQYLSLRTTRNSFWTRDAMPMALIGDGDRLSLADARYWTGFEPDRHIAALLGADLASYDFTFAGGNLLANHLGDCFTVDSKDTRRLTDAHFATAFGCRTVARLPKRGGIGHIDERAQFVAPGVVVTDAPEYVPVFEQRGFRVRLLPRPRGKYETYINVLIVNATVFVPQFQRPTDTEAVQAYAGLGFQVVPLDARKLADKGHGLLHCFTKTYPPMPAGGSRVRHSLPR